jgi:hypothetical protein
MLITDQFVFIHFPRAGGTFIYDVVKKFFPSAFELGYHLPREALPQKYAHLPILGTIRNPWDFYISWYMHQHSNVNYTLKKNTLFGILSEDRKLNLGQTVQNALDLGINENKLERLIAALPEHYDFQTRNIPNLTKGLMERIRGKAVGLYTFRFNQLFGLADDVHFCRVEALRNDLISFFDDIGTPGDDLKNYILHLEKQNVSKSLHYSNYYTPELAQLVSTRDHHVIERFGFTFEHSPQDVDSASTISQGELKGLRSINAS